MASTTLSMGYDPIYIATHHIIRLFVLLLGLPVGMRLLSRAGTGEAIPARGRAPMRNAAARSPASGQAR